MKWRSAAVTAVWAVGATVAGGLGAWSLAGLDGARAGGRPLDDAAVRRALGEAPTTPTSPPATSPSPSSSPRPTPSATDRNHHRRTLRFPGGTATVECRPGDLVRLVSWSPDDGFHVEEYVRGPALAASLELEPTDEDASDDTTSDEDDTTVTFRCTDGRPRTVQPPADD
ncbi:hypothetical protein ACIBI4_17800 [Streptomyces sp. NPDC050418]|uniref:hypothetical protein n=1 Tax=Streptomyces sp. NPDC050418 TaxID=3365612 RepID=UPI00379B98C8